MDRIIKFRWEKTHQTSICISIQIWFVRVKHEDNCCMINFSKTLHALVLFSSVKWWQCQAYHNDGIINETLSINFYVFNSSFTFHCWEDKSAYFYCCLVLWCSFFALNFVELFPGWSILFAIDYVNLFVLNRHLSLLELRIVVNRELSCVMCCKITKLAL